MKLTKDEGIWNLGFLTAIVIRKKKKKRGKKEKIHRTTKFKEDLILFDLSGFDFKRTSAELYKGHYAMLNNKQLKNAIDSLSLKFDERSAIIKENILNKYHFYVKELDRKRFKKKDSTYTQKARMYDYAINKLRTLKSVANANKSDLEYFKSNIL